MWVNDGENKLYFVKRKNVEEYHTGSFSYATPKLYMLGHAKAQCKRMNKREAAWLEGAEEKAKRHYEEKGEWIVAEIQMTVSDIGYDWRK